MRVLIACEFSGIVRDAFIERGHQAVSCDLLPTEKPGPHYQGDVFDIVKEQWDLMIAHPPCTYLCVTANRSFINNPERWKNRLEAMLFVHALLNSDIAKICLENPVGVISTYIRKPDQYIQPYEYGHPFSKKTGLWLKGLPKLQATDRVKPEWVVLPSGRRMSKIHARHPSTNNAENAKLRSRTCEGIANAMADQWS